VSFETDPLSAEEEEAARALFARFAERGSEDLRRGNLEASEVLSLLMARFTALPYENISKILQREMHGESGYRFPSVVVEDHLRHGLGGTCFSLTFLLEKLLGKLGIAGRPVMAHMSWGADTHCALLADAPEGSFLLDPGYAVNVPVLLPRRGSTVTRTAFGELEIMPREDPAGETVFDVFTRRHRDRRWRYSFAPRRTERAEFFRHWRDSFSGPSLHEICVYRATSHGHLYLRRNHLRLTSFRRLEREHIGRDLPRAVEDHFGIDSRWVERAEEALSGRRRARRAHRPEGKAARRAAPEGDPA
jgi:arylamine N-acetyltransferase